MARKKSEKTIHLITETFDSALELLQSLEPGPVHLLSGETPDGLGIYLCDEPFTLEEAEAQHSIESYADIDEPDDVDVPFDVVEDE